MACWCADWCTGVTTCYGQPSPFNNDPGCQELCHQNGKAYGCFSAFGGCGDINDGCGDGLQWCICIHPEYCCYCGSDICLPPNVDLGLLSQEALYNLVPAYYKDAECSPTPFGPYNPPYTLPHPWDEVYAFQNQSRCSKLPITACCRKDCAEWITPTCRNLTPVECSAQGGSWVERYQVGSSFLTNPCGAPEVCDIQPCCKLASAPDYDWPPFPTISRMISLCDMRTPTRCDTTFPAGHPQVMQMGGRSCWRPHTCVNPLVGQGCQCNERAAGCVGGDAESDYAMTFRPLEHMSSDLPVRPNYWDDAELVTKNPQRAIEDAGGLDDCKYLYAALGFVEDAPSGAHEVMAVGCGRIFGDDFAPFFGPGVFRENGDVRFFGSYLARGLS